MSPTSRPNTSSKKIPLANGPILRSVSNGSTSISMSKQTNKPFSNDDLMNTILDEQRSQSVEFQELYRCLTSLKN